MRAGTGRRAAGDPTTDDREGPLDRREHAECRRPPRGVDELGDDRLDRRVLDAGRDPPDGDPDEDRGEAGAEGERGDDGDEDGDGEQDAAADAVVGGADGEGGDRLGEHRAGIGQRDGRRLEQSLPDEVEADDPEGHEPARRQARGDGIAPELPRQVAADRVDEPAAEPASRIRLRGVDRERRHVPAEDGEEQHRDSARDREDGQAGPDGGAGGDGCDDEGAGERPDLVQGLVDAEAATPPDPGRGLGEEADLLGLRTALPVRSSRMRTAATARPAPPSRGLSASRGTQTAVRP